jgi:glutamine amidotransferase-like uncharacterized protein
MKKNILLLLSLFVISPHIIGCTGSSFQKYLRNEIDVILFEGSWKKGFDIESYRELSEELGLTYKIVGADFINNREEFFDAQGNRKFKVLIFPGGDAAYWFEKKPKSLPPPAAGMIKQNINCQGVKNVLDFVHSGGSAIGICHCSTVMFSERGGWLNPSVRDAGNLEKQHPDYKGDFNRVCGIYAFKGKVVGPQREVWPYPQALFLPLKMNPENEIVREAKVPPVVHIIVTGAGSIVADAGQSLDVVAWFPNGTAAIAVAPYGLGRVIMSGPHPNITGERAARWREGMMGKYASWYGTTEETIRQNKKTMQANPDPDGEEPDWALAKAMLSYAYKQASK